MPFGSLWIPVVVSTIAVFVASSIVHMALRYHRADVKALPDEEAAREALGKQKTVPGVYYVPYCLDAKQMKEPATKEKFAKGPVAMITLVPSGAPRMGKHLAQWLGLVFLVSFTAAYVARLTLAPGAAGMLVMRVTGAVAFGCYGISHISDSIWKAQPWDNTGRALLDAVIYAIVTGVTFRLLWPA
jgi:hypothetical protein